MDDRWAAGDLKKNPFYAKGRPAYEVIRAMQNADYVELAEQVVGRPFGCNGIGKLKEIALHYPNKYDVYHDNPVFQQDPDYWNRLWGSGSFELEPTNLEGLQGEWTYLAKVLEDNGVKVHWVEFPEPPMGPYGPMMGQIYLAWGMIWRGGSVISKMGFLPAAIGLTEYLAKWAWDNLNIPVLTAITEGACEPGACRFLAQDVVVTARSCAFTDEGVNQFVSALEKTSGTKEFHNLVIRPPVYNYFDPNSGACAHPDMIIAPIDTGKVLIHPPAIDWAARKWLEDNGFEMIEVDHQEQTALLGPCNLIPLEPGRILMHAECERTIAKVREAGVEVIEVPGTEILKLGGGIRCGTMQIHREEGPSLEDVRRRKRN